MEKNPFSAASNRDAAGSSAIAPVDRYGRPAPDDWPRSAAKWQKSSHVSPDEQAAAPAPVIRITKNPFSRVDERPAGSWDGGAAAGAPAGALVRSPGMTGYFGTSAWDVGAAATQASVSATAGATTPEFALPEDLVNVDEQTTQLLGNYPAAPLIPKNWIDLDKFLTRRPYSPVSSETKMNTNWDYDGIVVGTENFVAVVMPDGKESSKCWKISFYQANSGTFENINFPNPQIDHKIADQFTLVGGTAMYENRTAYCCLFLRSKFYKEYLHCVAFVKCRNAVQGVEWTYYNSSIPPCYCIADNRVYWAEKQVGSFKRVLQYYGRKLDVQEWFDFDEPHGMTSLDNVVRSKLAFEFPPNKHYPNILFSGQESVKPNHYGYGLVNPKENKYTYYEQKVINHGGYIVTLPYPDGLHTHLVNVQFGNIGQDDRFIVKVLNPGHKRITVDLSERLEGLLSGFECKEYLQDGRVLVIIMGRQDEHNSHQVRFVQCHLDTTRDKVHCRLLQKGLAGLQLHPFVKPSLITRKEKTFLCCVEWTTMKPVMVPISIPASE